MRANYLMSGVAQGMRRNLLMTIALVLITAVSLVFLGSAFLTSTEISRFRKLYENRLNVSIYLCADKTATCTHKVTAAERVALQRQLQSDPLITAVSFVSEQQAYERGKQVLDPAIAQFIEPGQLPSSFTVKLKESQKDYDAVRVKYEKQPGVDNVQNQDASIETILNIIDSARLLSIVGAIVVLFCAVIMMAITIQVAAQQRRAETSIMRLVGASRWMTQLPFIIEAMIAAAIGGILAIAALWGGKQFVLNSIFRTQVSRGVIPDLSASDVLLAGSLCLLIGVVLAAITAAVTLRAYVRL
jgi:cell division transport system permease protein